MLNQKQLLRDRIIQRRQSLSPDIVAVHSKKICNRLEQTDLFKASNCVALYCAIDNEVQTSELIEAWRTKKQIVLPIISGENMFFSTYTGKENLIKGVLGIAEPISNEIVSPDSIDLFIVPGIAFDYDCNRLGRGKAYYDRYLSHTDKSIIGLCYDFQLLEQIPWEKHDKKMTFVLTESIIVSSTTNR